MSPSLRRKVEKAAGGAARVLSERGAIPSAEVIASIYDSADLPLDAVTMPYGSMPEGAAGVPAAEIGMAICNEDVALAVLPEDELVFFRPEAIASFLQQDPDAREVTDWASLVYMLIVYNFRVARVSRHGERFRLDVHASPLA